MFYFTEGDSSDSGHLYESLEPAPAPFDSDLDSFDSDTDSDTQTDKVLATLLLGGESSCSEIALLLMSKKIGNQLGCTATTCAIKQLILKQWIIFSVSH